MQIAMQILLEIEVKLQLQKFVEKQVLQKIHLAEERQHTKDNSPYIADKIGLDFFNIFKVTLLIRYL